MSQTADFSPITHLSLVHLRPLMTHEIIQRNARLLPHDYIRLPLPSPHERLTQGRRCPSQTSKYKSSALSPIGFAPLMSLSVSVRPSSMRSSQRCLFFNLLATCVIFTSCKGSA